MTQSRLHAIEYCNMGNTTITFIKINYGEVIWPLTSDRNDRGGKDLNCSGGSSLVSQMPVPEVMTVEWAIENGKTRKVNIPVKSGLDSRYPVRAIKVKFNNDHVEVVARVYETSTRRVDQRIYP